MSGTPYMAQDILDQASEALRQGRTLESLASQLRCSSEHLAKSLGISTTSKPIPQTEEIDLFACERLNAVL
jgi:hypothetical protein